MDDDCTTDFGVSIRQKVDFLSETVYSFNPYPNFTNCLPPCGICQAFHGEGPYVIYNLIVIGFVLPMIGLFGLFGNSMSAFLYSRPMLRSSTNLYLCALGCSDCAIILTAMFLFFMDSIRRYSVHLSTTFGQLSPIIYPAGLAAQTCSVYFTVVAAVDCFVQVCLSNRVKRLFVRPKQIMISISCVVVFSILYNVPHCFEAVVIECWHDRFQTESLELCADPFRFTPTYLLIYYKYMYTVFQAVGPLLVLIVLNSLIIAGTILRRRRATSDAADNPGDTITLILVVLLFISCNLAALLINIFEEKLNEKLGSDVNYVVDMSNLAVVLNASANFIIYYTFSETFRNAFKHYIRRGLLNQCAAALRRNKKKRTSANGTLPLTATSTTTTTAAMSNGQHRTVAAAGVGAKRAFAPQHLTMLIVDEPEVLI